MRVVVDANVVAAALIRPEGWTWNEMLRRDLDLFAPDFILLELEKWEAELAQKAGVALSNWRRRVSRVTGRLTLLDHQDWRKHESHPLVRAIDGLDPDDGPYIATFLATDAKFLWTNDKAIQRVLGSAAGPAVPTGDDE